jgi:4-hydroxy-3-polyprenylbenzoate decarboxylase
MPGIIALSGPKFSDQQNAEDELAVLINHLKGYDTLNLKGFPLIILCDDSDFVAKDMNNFLWATFTRSNPSHDIYGTNSFVHHKHWGCKGELIIDARIKTHHAPLLIKDAAVEKRVDELGTKGKSLYGII